MAEIVIPSTLIGGENKPVSAATSADLPLQAHIDRFTAQPNIQPFAPSPAASLLRRPDLTQPAAPEGPQQS